MTIMRTSFIAAFGLLAAGLAAPASAGVLVATTPAVAFEDSANLHEITDSHRGSWKKKKHRRHGRDYSRHRGRDYHGDPRPHYGKHFKKKRRHFRRGYSRGYDEGYYEGRRHSRYERRHRRQHRHFPDYGFRGGFSFGDGYYNGGGFRFRY